MFIDSICPKCGEISHVEYKGQEVVVVTCKHFHKYDHVVTHLPKHVRMKDDKRRRLEEMILEKKFQRMSDKSIICLLIFENGYEIEGRATVQNIADFRFAVGKDIAYEHALKRSLVALGPVLN